MVKAALLAGLCMAMLAVPAGAAVAQQRQQGAVAEVSAQESYRERRAPRLRVNPGRLLYRDCDFKLVQQWRPSGTVIVPQQRCWWVRG